MDPSVNDDDDGDNDESILPDLVFPSDSSSSQRQLANENDTNNNAKMQEMEENCEMILPNLLDEEDDYGGDGHEDEVQVVANVIKVRLKRKTTAQAQTTLPPPPIPPKSIVGQFRRIFSTAGPEPPKPPPKRVQRKKQIRMDPTQTPVPVPVPPPPSSLSSSVHRQSLEQIQQMCEEAETMSTHDTPSSGNSVLTTSETPVTVTPWPTPTPILLLPVVGCGAPLGGGNSVLQFLCYTIGQSAMALNQTLQLQVAPNSLFQPQPQPSELNAPELPVPTGKTPEPEVGQSCPSLKRNRKRQRRRRKDEAEAPTEQKQGSSGPSGSRRSSRLLARSSVAVATTAATEARQIAPKVDPVTLTLTQLGNRNQDDVDDEFSTYFNKVSSGSGTPEPEANITAARQRSCRCTFPPCAEQFLHSDQRTRHEVKVHGARGPFGCDYAGCGSTHYSMRELTDHKRRAHTLSRPFLCEACGSTYRSKSHLVSYRRRVHPSNSTTTPKDGEGLLCPGCGKLCPDQATLTRHAVSHSDQRPWHCDQCPGKFKTQGGLNIHLSSSHGSARPFKCRHGHCDKVFSTGAKRNLHEFSHAKVKSFACDLCPKKFKGPGGLRAHKKFHAGGDKVHKCGFCEQSYSQRANLDYHVLSKHTKVEDRKYACPLCPNSRRFVRKFDLDVHAQTHNPTQAGKRFKCDLCTWTFRTAVRLKSHRKLKHGVLDDVPLPLPGHPGVETEAATAAAIAEESEN